MTPSWLNTALGAICLLLSADPALAIRVQSGLRKPASPGYRGRDTACPETCHLAGPDPSNWSLYHNFDQLRACHKTLFYHFSLYDQVDDPNALHRLYACTSYGSEWSSLPGPTTKSLSATETVNSTYSLGWWSEGALAVPYVMSVSGQMGHYLKSQHVATKSTKENTFLFAKSGSATVGIFIGKGLNSKEVSSFALDAFIYNINNLKINSMNAAMQLCDPSSNNVHTFGLFASTNGTFAPVQEAMKKWSSGGCLSFDNTKNITGPAVLTTPILKISANNTSNGNGHSNSTLSSRGKLAARADCKTTQVEAGDSCAALATKCGISASDFTKYNPNSKLCSSLTPGQHVCCSSGSLPDFSPKPNSDGSCATYTIVQDDNCANLAAKYSLTNDDIEDFNKNTWGWNGCSNVWVGTKICLSKGTPPMPASVANAVCGPQVPGTEAPDDTSDIAMLNPCPLNACCNVWGQCGITDEFCTDTSTGAPGSAKPGTNGCVSNCGTSIVRGDAPAEFRSVAYFEGFNLGSRECLYQDGIQIDGSRYTHLHFAFGALTSDYEVIFPDKVTEYEFQNFMSLDGPKKILSFGGWDFSTNPSTYNIFREGVKPNNRLIMAANIVKFVNDNELDGVDIDWEYPGAPDIPGIPPDDKDSGLNYLGFLVVLKNLLAGKSLSIAAASSYWYLKNFPIESIGMVVDYIVYMTYDLHGQWDAGNANAQVGCPTGACLRSQVNLTETISSLVMITKAGVPSNKVVVGVTSYGRSFAMADPGCSGPDCLFTGGPTDSQATPGRCTTTGGYISNAEINEILGVSPSSTGLEKRDRVNQHFRDEDSDSDILIYDSNQWVAYLSDETKASRKSLYQGLNMGGTTDWATDLQVYNPVPSTSASWTDYILAVKNGQDPAHTSGRTGNWSQITCDDPNAQNYDLAPSKRWSVLGASDAWQNAIDQWKNKDRAKKIPFMTSISRFLHGPASVDCSSFQATSNCAQTLPCDSFDHNGGGPAAALIWDSLIFIYEMLKNYWDALEAANSDHIQPSADAFSDAFDPPDEPKDNIWLDLLEELVSIAAPAVASPFLKFILPKLPGFTDKEGQEKIESVFNDIISGSIGYVGDLFTSTEEGHWTAENQNTFEAYMGDSISAWRKMAENSVHDLFSGSDDAIELLTDMISDGKFIDSSGAEDSPSDLAQGSASALEDALAKTFFSFAIPNAWTSSGHKAFIVDAGYDCDHEDDIFEHFSPDTMTKAKACYNNKRYYLALPDGDPLQCQEGQCYTAPYSLPKGVDELDGKAFGGVTIEDIVIASVRTYLANGGVNGGDAPDPLSSSALDDLYDDDLPPPGLIGLPVCSADSAWKAWNHPIHPDTNAPNYPCLDVEGMDWCFVSTFVDQTSDASPSVADCMQIVANIAGTQGQWSVLVGGLAQRELASYGSCKFGVTPEGLGNAEFEVGAQDIVDIITESVKEFGGSGKVGSKGEFTCVGSIHDQKANWGLY